MSLSRWYSWACLGLSLLLTSCLGDRSDPPHQLRIGTGERPGLYYTMGEVLAGLVNEETAETSLVMEVEETSGSVFNINAVMARSLQFGFSQMDRQADAYAGHGFWEGMPQERLRFICSLYPEVVAILALEGSGLEKVSDLQGKRVNIGAPGSGTRDDALAILRAAELQEGKDYQTDEAPPREAIRKLQSGEIDALFYTAGASSPLLKAAAAAKPAIRLLSVSNLQGLLREEESMEPVTLPGLGEEGPVKSVMMRTVLLTSIDVPEEEVYEVTRILFEGLDVLREGQSQFADLNPEEMIQGSIAPIHPGALKYYRQMGWLTK